MASSGTDQAVDYEVTIQLVNTPAETAFAREVGIGVNAGHDLNQNNLGHLISKIPWIAEVSIGHALICEALEQGLETTVHGYLDILKKSAN